MLRKNKENLPDTVKTGKKKKKVPLIIGGVVVAIIVVSFAASKLTPKALPQVPVSAVTKEDLTANVDTSGTVESLKTKTYFSPVNATISQYPLKVGEVVKPGDSLVAFDVSTLEQDNQKAQLNVSATVNGSKDSVAKAAETQQKANEAAGKVPTLQANVDSYQEYVASLKTAIADRTRELTDWAKQESTDASVALTQAQADLTKLQQELEGQKAKQQQLNAQAEELKAAIAEAKKNNQDTTDLERQWKDLNAQAENMDPAIDDLTSQMNDKSDEVTQLQINQIENQSAQDPTSDAQIVEWQNELESATTELSEMQSELAEQKSLANSADGAKVTEAAKAQMQATNNIAELEAASLEELLEKGKQGLQAEFSGIVSKADTSQGSAASQGMELITIASNEEVAVNVTVSKYDYDKLKEGQKATITIADHTYKGTVSRISKMATTNEKGAPVIWAEVKIDNPDDNIFLGVEAKVSIETGSAKGVVSVPVNAVNTGKDSTFCYVVKDGVIARQDVETGISSSEYTEIKSGLKLGDSVIAELPDGFAEGMKVEEAAAGSTSGAQTADAVKE